MDSQVEEIKQKIDIVSLINEYVALKKSGRNYKAVCPFHSEKTPSFMVSPELGIFKCFGCGKAGDIFAFIKEIERVEFGEALRILANKAGIVLKEFRPREDQKQIDALFKMHSLAASFYQKLLKGSYGEKSLSYLKARGVTNRSIDDFSLGYSERSGNQLLNYLKKEGFNDSSIEKGGLAIYSEERSEFFDRFRGRVMFPIKDLQGKVVGFTGRILGDGEPKYLNSPDSLIFHKSQILYGLDLAKDFVKKEGFAILVEGNLDLISSWQIGVKNITAPLGTSMSEGQVRFLKKFTDSILISFDADLAGDEAVRRGVGLAEKEGLNIKIITLEYGKDPDECIKKNPLLWKKSVAEAEPIYDYYIESAVQKYGLESGEAKKRIGEDVLPALAKISDSLMQSHYIQKLALRLHLNEEAVSSALKRYSNKELETVQYSPQVNLSPLKTNQIELVEKYLLSLILQGEFIPEKLTPKFFKIKEFQEIFALAVEFKRNNKNFVLKRFSLNVPPELKETFTQLTLGEIGQIAEDEIKLRKEIGLCLKRLIELSVRSKLKILSSQIEEAEGKQEFERLEELKDKFKKLSGRLVSLDL